MAKTKKTEDKADTKPAGGGQVPVAVANLVSQGMSLADARKQIEG